jgi:hypothetical protein
MEQNLGAHLYALDLLAAHDYHTPSNGVPHWRGMPECPTCGGHETQILDSDSDSTYTAVETTWSCCSCETLIGLAYTEDEYNYAVNLYYQEQTHRRADRARGHSG